MSTFTGNNSLFNYQEYDNSFSGTKKNLSNNLEDIITTGGTIKYNKLKKK